MRSSKWCNYNVPFNVQDARTYRQVSYKAHFNRPLNCWSLRCILRIACTRCFNHILILHLTHGFNTLHKDNCKPRREPFKFWDLVRLISENLRYWWCEPRIDHDNNLYYDSLCIVYVFISKYILRKFKMLKMEHELMSKVRLLHSTKYQII